MRIKYPDLVRLLVVLAIVCSLAGIVAVPAGADVSNGNVTAAPATASDAASYTVVFQVGSSGALTGNVSTISITFPTGTTMPSSISKLYITVNGTQLVADPTVSAQTVSLITPVSVANNAAVTVVISQVAGIKNPAIGATTYRVQMNTSVEPNLVYSNYYTITPSYAISTTTADRGTMVTVTGKGWAPNQSVAIGGALSGTGVILADGTFSVTAAPVGSGNVTCADGSGGTNVTWGLTPPTFTLKARVTITPTSGNVGSTVVVKGYDFTQNGNISANQILLGGVSLANANINLTTIDAYGTLDDFVATLTVLATITGGSKTVQVTDTGLKIATTTYTVNKPTITLSPTSGQPNTMVTVSGSYFAAADTITTNTPYALGAVGLWFAPAVGAGSTWNTSTITVDASGNWAYSVRAPATAVEGNNPVLVTTTAGTSASTVFVVSARALTIQPASGPKGTTVVLTGANMTPSGTVTALTFGGPAWTGAPLPINIDSLGTIFPTTLQIPTGLGTGPQAVVATDSGTPAKVATGSFTITQPTLTISPTTGYKGDTITVTGSGWVPGAMGAVPITFTPLGGTAVLIGLATPDAAGNITAAFTVPVTASALGNTVTATDTAYGNAAPPQTFLLGTAKITLSPTEGPVGTQVTVTGVGFQPQTGLSALTIGGVNVLPLTPVVTDTVGKFTATFAVPGLGIGAQAVNATVVNTVTAFFTIKAGAASVKDQLASISGKVVRVWTYTGGKWYMYDPADQPGSDLASLSAGDGFWINVNADCTLVYGTKSYTLTSGWNLKGWQG